MKNKFSRLSGLVLFVPAFCFVTGCKTGVKTLPAAGAIRADVVSFDPASVQSPSDVPKFIYGTQTFPQITDINTLSGPRMRVLQGGDLEIQETFGTVIMSNRFSGYSIPSLEYRIVDGVVKPLSTKSLTLLSASFQFDTLISKIEVLTGITPVDFFSGLSSFDVLYHPAVKISSSDEVLRKYETTNAAYVAGARQFALFTEGKDERLPMAYNPQIVAHEFGHAIFERTFFNNKFERCVRGNYIEQKLFPGRLEQEFVIRGINEGFADIVSFVWTGSSNILQSALGESASSRERDFFKSTFDYTEYSFNLSDVCKGGYYCIGTLWAKTLFEVYMARGLDPKNSSARQEFLREIVQLKSDVGKSLREFDGDRLPKPDDKASICQSREELSPSYDEDMLAVFFEAVVENVEAAKRKTYCDAIAKYFGATAFPDSVRGNCK
jgi:hypothetical protein